MKRNSTMSLFAAMLLLTGSGCILMTGCQKDYDGQIEILRNQIENGDVNVDNLLEKIELIEKQIVTLQEQPRSMPNSRRASASLSKTWRLRKMSWKERLPSCRKQWRRMTRT